MTQTELPAIASPSLADIVHYVGNTNQHKWLRRYNRDEFVGLLRRHCDSVFTISNDDGKLLGAAIAYAGRNDETTVHIAFILVDNQNVLRHFVSILRRRFPQATTITYLRRGRLGRCPINRLHQMFGNRK